MGRYGAPYLPGLGRPTMQPAPWPMGCICKQRLNRDLRSHMPIALIRVNSPNDAPRACAKTHTASPYPPSPKETSNELVNTATACDCHRCQVRCAMVLCCLRIVGGTSAVMPPDTRGAAAIANATVGAPASVARRVRSGRFPAQHVMANPLAHCVKCACWTTCKNSACMA
jgi:hypothetical protein